MFLEISRKYHYQKFQNTMFCVQDFPVSLFLRLDDNKG